ncbi:putative bifunctional diguanylate cyclase/phosphodiesterase [Clostridium paraputrificum]|uniref:putative bifunctional diguanylate cyclase/phosphodiesterase n=1 Tax=Clostridium paraputrificum TaxID=29363 RepID=UPI0034A58E39
MGNTKEKKLKEISIFIILILLGCLLKISKVELFFGIIIEFASIFLLLILFIFGFKKAVIGALTISIFDLLFNGNIVYVFISFCEVLFIIYFIKKNKNVKVIIIDFFFWISIIILSIILIFVGEKYDGFIEYNYFPILILSVNSMLNTLIAEVIYEYVIKDFIYREKFKIEFKGMIFHILSGAILVPFIINIFIDMVNSYDYISNTALTSAKEVYDSVFDEIDDWDEKKIYNLKLLGVIELGYLGDVIQKSCNYKEHNVHIKDKKGNIIIDFINSDKYIEDYDEYDRKNMSDYFWELLPKRYISMDYNKRWADGYFVYESEIGNLGLYLMVEVPIIIYKDRIIKEYIGQFKFLVLFSIFILLIGKLLISIVINDFNKINNNATNFLKMIDSKEVIMWPRSSIMEIDLLTDNIKNMVNSLRVSFIKLKESQDKLYRQAYYDSLTNLPNRLFFKKYLKDEIKDCENSICVMFMDLNRFKTINDTMGHDIGDKLLVLVAERLKSLQDEKHHIFRLGGDEFVIVSKVNSIEEIKNDGIRAVEIFKEKFILEDKFSVKITGSIGASIYPQDGTDIDKIIKYADIAMYESKCNGGNSLYLFNDTLKKEFYEKATIEKEVKNAIENNELYLEYQPQVSAKDGKIRGIEALLRWKNDRLGIVPPDKFIPIAEESEVILEIDRWVISEVCKVIRMLQDEGYNNITISANVSAKHFVNDDILDLVLGGINKNNINPKLLKIEITESTFIKNVSTVKRILERFKEIGIRTSMDDFGKGYSSLNILTSLPIDEVKIDMELIKNILNNNKKRKIVNLILELAHDLNLSVVAEGIEVKEEKLFLEKMGCDYFQGYYFSKPIALDKVKELLDK